MKADINDFFATLDFRPLPLCQVCYPAATRPLMAHERRRIEREARGLGRKIRGWVWVPESGPPVWFTEGDRGGYWECPNDCGARSWITPQGDCPWCWPEDSGG